MPETTDTTRLRNLAAELLKAANGDAAVAAPKLASNITDDFELANSIAADYLARLAAMHSRLLQEFGLKADES